MAKNDKVDPNFEAALNLVNPFVPVLIMLMTKNHERQELRAQGEPDPELLKEFSERVGRAKAEKAEHETAVAEEKLAQEKAKTASLQTLMSELSNKVAGLESRDNPVPVKEIAEAFRTIQNGSRYG
jgi:hypothetical protein